MRAVVNLRDTPAYRKESFLSGLQKAGFDIVAVLRDPKPDDVLVIWNRSGGDSEQAGMFERAGARVIVCENGYMGREWNDSIWYAMSLGQHNGAGSFPCTHGARWRKYGFELAPVRQGGTEIVMLPQRGIGQLGVAMPRGWENDSPVKCRIRKHPGIQPCISLDDDLANARAVYTWGSGAAIKAMALGIPVVYAFNRWIAGCGGVHVSAVDWDNIAIGDRLTAFERVFDAMYRLDEIESGIAFNHILGG